MAIITGSGSSLGNTGFTAPFPPTIPVDRVQQSSVFETYVTDDFSALYVNPLWRSPSTVLGEMAFLQNTVAGISAQVAAQFDLRNYQFDLPEFVLSGENLAAADAAAQASSCPCV